MTRQPRSLLVVALVVAAALPALAQGRRDGRSSRFAPVTIPRPIEARLKNGLRVLIVENRLMPTVSASLMIDGAGATFEPRSQRGIASLTAEMVAEGGRTSPRKKALAQRMESMGASIGSRVGALNTVIQASGLSTTFERWFPLALEAVVHPEFPERSLTALKTQAVTSIQAEAADPSSLADERLTRALFGDHPAGRAPVTVEEVERTSTATLADWHRARYAPQNAVLAIVGDVSAPEVVAKLERWLGDWKRTRTRPARVADPVAPSRAQIHLIDRPGSAQVTLRVGSLAIDRRNPDLCALEVANQILGGGMRGRLFRNLRGDKGWTYGAYSGFSAGRWRGPWVIETDVRADVASQALGEVLGEINRMRDRKVTRTELAETKSSILGGLAVSLEKADSVLGYAVEQKLFGLPKKYWDSYQRQIASLKAGDVQSAVKKYLDPASLQIVVVGDAKALRPSLEGLGLPIVEGGRP